MLTSVVLLILGATLELTDQEAYYWTWSTQPALGYFEHPPLQAWLTGLFSHLFGDGAWVVRLPALIGRAVALFALAAWARRREGRHVAELTVALALGSFLFLAGGLIALPDSVMIPFAVLTMKYADERRWWACGVALGFAALGKWTAAMLIPGVAASALLRPARRSWRGLLLCGALALLFQLPPLIWNSQHEWASFHFHLQQRHHHAAPPLLEYLKNATAFLGSQFVLGGPAFVFALFVAMKGRKPARTTSPDAPVSLAWWIVPSFALFGLSAARGELRFYWTSVAYPAICLAVARNVANLEPSTKARYLRVQKQLTYFTLAALAAILFLPVGAYLKPFTDLYKPYDLRHSPRGDLAGWQDWVREDLAPAGLTSPDVVFVASDFRLASQAAWALDSHDMARFETVGPPFQFRFWPRPQVGTRAVLFWDNRHAAGALWPLYCEHELTWRYHPVLLGGQLIKDIHWATCEKWRRP